MLLAEAGVIADHTVVSGGLSGGHVSNLYVDRDANKANTSDQS